MDTAAMVLSFDPEREELARAMARHSVAVTRAARICMLLGGILIALGVWALFVAANRINDAVAGAAIMFGLLLLVFNSPWARRTQLRNVIRRTPAFTGHREVTAAADGLRIVTPTSDSRLAWSHYENVADDELGVTLMLRGGTTAHLVPRRAFADVREQSAWAERVSAWVAEASGSSEAIAK
jgi:hypothetical protein